MSGDEGETDVKLNEAWGILWRKFPGFHEFLLSLTNQPVVRRAIERQLTSGMEDVRSQDTATLKRRVPSWTNEDPKIPLDPPLPSLKEKVYRGMVHPVFARLLTPMECEANEATYLEFTTGVRHLTGTQLPRFIFPLNQVFPVGEPPTDPAWAEALDNALKGEIVLRSAKALFMGPESALEGDGYHKGKPGNAEIINLTTFNRCVCAGVVVQVYFSLSAEQEWHKNDGPHFNYEDLFWTIYGLFDNDKWGKEIIALWNKVVLGKAAGVQSAPAPLGPSHLEQLKTARAAAALAAANASPTTAEPVPEAPAAGAGDVASASAVAPAPADVATT
ncbi:hypothetical protein B0H17DRAFT_1148441 [Mycena rosella]|uniref:Uncharacterized protein n=1 Tax=Mycena rosella TaxID=1033263 RepID=A0AAD7FY42_MYCRO|nr:hypothetical protein B0H17DRAFT_1148441 [Mycena rosella]